MAPGAMVLGAAVLAGAIVARPAAFVEADRAGQEEVAGEPSARIEGGAVLVSAAGDDLGPDLLVYGIPLDTVKTTDVTALPSEAVLLGPKSPGRESRFEASVPLFELALYSLGHGEVKAWLALDAQGGER